MWREARGRDLLYSFKLTPAYSIPILRDAPALPSTTHAHASLRRRRTPVSHSLPSSSSPTMAATRAYVSVLIVGMIATVSTLLFCLTCCSYFPPGFVQLALVKVAGAPPSHSRL